MLAKLVQRGMLPPVDLRVPANPCVLPALENMRKYDGLIHRAYTGVSDRWGPTKMKDHALAWFDSSLNLVARLCASWEVNPNATEWTFHLRPGTRWSDGIEFTTDEIVWWDQHVLKDTRLTPILPSTWSTNGQLMTLTVTDKYTFKVVFTQPKVMFINSQTRAGLSTESIICPSHYLRRYHLDFAPDPIALQAEALAAGFSDWADYFNNNRNYWYLNPARPELGPWLAKNAMGQALFVMERNPYYYCVDADQQQLPYVDVVTHRNYDPASDTFDNWIKQGMIDFQARGVNFLEYSDYQAYQTTGGYHVVLGALASHLAIALNHTTKTPRLRDFFQIRKVRIALSLAVNRTAMNNLYYYGLATPRQYSPLSRSPQYYPVLSNAYIAYDVAQANTLLNEAGYTLKDAQGFRLWNDGSGQRISFIIEGTSPAGSLDYAAVQQVIQYYAVVGIVATYQYVDRSTYNQHYGTNQIEAAWWGGDRTILPLVTDAIIFRGVQTDRPWADAWGLWYNNHSDPNGEEPPADHWIRTIWSLWDQISIQPDSSQRNLLFNQILDIWATELPMIGYLGELPALAIVKNNLHNFLAGFPYDDTSADEEVYNPETYSWDSSLTASLAINYPDGKPGSFFTLVGTNFPPRSTALVSVNERAIDTLFTDDSGRVEFILETAQASIGFYEVTVRVNPAASATFKLSGNSSQRPAEGSAVHLAVPAGVASNSTFLPIINRK